MVNATIRTRGFVIACFLRGIQTIGPSSTGLASFFLTIICRYRGQHDIPISIYERNARLSATSPDCYHRAFRALSQHLSGNSEPPPYPPPQAGEGREGAEAQGGFSCARLCGWQPSLPWRW